MGEVGAVGVDLVAAWWALAGGYSDWGETPGGGTYQHPQSPRTLDSRARIASLLCILISENIRIAIRIAERLKREEGKRTAHLDIVLLHGPLSNLLLRSSLDYTIQAEVLLR